MRLLEYFFSIYWTDILEKNVNRFRELLRPIDIQDAFSGTSFDNILKVFICVSG